MYEDKHILWDLDGTIVKSENKEFKRAMFRYASEKIGLNFTLPHEDYLGKEAQSVFTKILHINGIQDISEYQVQYNYWYEQAVSYILNNIDYVRERDNVVEIWKDLSDLGIRNSVVTSSREDIAIAYLKKIGLLGLCQSLVCVNHVSKPKPSPEPYLQCMKNLQTHSGNCIGVEDSVTGISSAVKAGLKTLAWVENPEYFRNTDALLVTTEINPELILNLF